MRSKNATSVRNLVGWFIWKLIAGQTTKTVKSTIYLFWSENKKTATAFTVAAFDVFLIVEILASTPPGHDNQTAQTEYQES